MGKIKDIDNFKSQLVLGEVKCSYLWNIDGQSNLKGNPLKAFESSLDTICSFQKIKKGRVTYYCVEEIYEVNLERKHKNSIAMLNNRNKSGKIGFKEDSNVEFVAAVLINKVEYFTAKGDKSFKSISSWAKICGFTSRYEKVNNLLRNMVDRAIIKLEKLGFIGVETKYMAGKFNGVHTEVSKEFFEEYKKRSREAFKKVVGEEMYKQYKSFFMFTTYYKYYDKLKLEMAYWNEMNTNIKYVYRCYKLKFKITISDIENKIYMRLLDVLFEEDHFGEYNINECIYNFIKSLEISYET